MYCEAKFVVPNLKTEVLMSADELELKQHFTRRHWRKKKKEKVFVLRFEISRKILNAL